MKLKLGIVGLGRLGMEYAKNIAYRIPDAQLYAACSIQDNELKIAKESLEVPYLYSSYQKMLKNKDIDAIVIVTTTNQHADQIILALESGFHVFCEKPLAIDIENCIRVQKKVKEFPHLISMLGFVRRYDRSYSEAKVKLDEGLVGEPVFIRSQTADKDTLAPFQVEFCTAGGGIFHDYSVHDIDLIHWFTGSNIKKVWSLGGAYRFEEFEKAGDADNAFAMCELENGTMALIGASRVSSFGHNTFTEIMATKGNLKIGDPPNKNRLQISDKFGVRHECLDSFYDRFREAFVSQIKDFVNCINKGVQPDLTIENAAKATLVATALTKSFKENGIVHVDDFNPKIKF